MCTKQKQALGIKTIKNWSLTIFKKDYISICFLSGKTKTDVEYLTIKQTSF